MLAKVAMEDATLLMGGPRIKFECVRTGDLPALSAEVLAALAALSRIMAALERLGGTPVLPDNRVGGNCAFRVSPSLLLVSRSGKEAGAALRVPADFVAVTAFDSERWSCSFASSDPSLRPSSDTPLLWHCCRGLAVHGHGIDGAADAEALSCPISAEETLFSTREDLVELEKLMRAHPQAPLYIRKGHGFFVLGKDARELQEHLAPVTSHLNRRCVRVFIHGLGGVGRTLLGLLARQTRRRFVVAGVSDSRGWCSSAVGVDVATALAAKARGGSVAELPGGHAGQPSAAQVAALCSVLFDARPFDRENKGLELLLQLLEHHGVSVVFTNKSPLALEYRRVADAASRGRTRFRFSSCVGGALPSVNLLARDLQGCRVLRIEAVLNVSSNIVLKLMESEEVTLEEACRSLAQRGLLETNPAQDIDGWDSAAKLAILANVMGAPLTMHGVKRTGIRSVTRAQLRAALAAGERIVLLCLYDAPSATFSVAPTALPLAHPLAKLSGEEMGIRFATDISGELFASCVHVDATPTAAAMIRDAYDLVE